MWVIAWADNKTEYDVIEKKVQQKKTEQISHRKKKIEILYFSWNVFFSTKFHSAATCNNTECTSHLPTYLGYASAPYTMRVIHKKIPNHLL